LVLDVEVFGDGSISLSGCKQLGTYEFEGEAKGKDSRYMDFMDLRSGLMRVKPTLPIRFFHFMRASRRLIASTEI